jgi:hypothetical protein
MIVRIVLSLIVILGWGALTGLVVPARDLLLSEAAVNQL